MQRKYDLFEKFPDGSSLWRVCVLGLEGTRCHLRELAQKSENRFYAMDVTNGKIVCESLDLGGVERSASRKSGGRSKSAGA